MKKFLAILLALTLVLALAACGGDGDKPTDGPTSGPTDGPTEEPTDAPEPTEPVVPEELPATALNHWDFESTDGLTPVYQAPKPEGTDLTGGITFEIAPSQHEIMFADGPVGKAAYLDGKYGIKLDMTAPTDDSYTIAFWYNGDRFITLGPIVQMGRNLGMADSADPATAVTWFNICQCDWGVDGASLTPTIWNRNSSISTEVSAGGVWPWVGPDTVYGKKEWAHVAVVVDGVRYTADDGMERIGCKLYVNGNLMFDANSENLFYQGVSPEIFQHIDTAIRGLEAYVGINYWDACYKGFIDDMYVYDEALTAGQVLSLYQLGDPSVASVAPEYTGPLDGDTPPEPTAPVLPEITPDANAKDTVGSVDRAAGFWTDTSDGFEVKDGASVTLKMNNYSDGLNNWDNFVLGFSNTAVTTDKVASADNFPGYAEWFVLRADAYGWAPEGRAYTPTFETSWGDDWAGWLTLMHDAEVTAVITRNGGEITVEYTFTGADGTSMTEKAVVTSDLTAADPCYVHVTTDHAYIEILSVE